MRIAVVDNYDSFTHNLIQLIGALGYEDVLLMKNDTINWSGLDGSDVIVLSPGPGLPHEAGDLMAVVERYIGIKPILGVCLGYQAIIEHLGGKLFNLSDVVHGQQAKIKVDVKSTLFGGMQEEQEVARYHSWGVNTVPDPLVVVAREENLIMAIESNGLKVGGVQFHPESVLTPNGPTVVENFIKQYNGASS